MHKMKPVSLFVASFVVSTLIALPAFAKVPSRCSAKGAPANLSPLDRLGCAVNFASETKIEPIASGAVFWSSPFTEKARAFASSKRGSMIEKEPIGQKLNEPWHLELSKLAKESKLDPKKPLEEQRKMTGRVWQIVSKRFAETVK